MLSAPGPIEAVTARVARRRVALAKAVAACTRACSLRPWMNGIRSWSWSRAWPMPATWPWPKMPRAAGTSRRRSPSATECWAARYLTMAWATVRRTVRRGVTVMGRSPFNGLSPGPAVEHDRLDLGHLLDGGAGARLADAAALEAAVRHQVGPPQGRPVDVDGPRVDLAHGPHGPGHVRGEDPRPEPVAGPVGLGDRLGPVVGPANGHRRPEQLLLAEGRGRVDVGHHGRLDHRPLAVAAGEHAGPGGGRLGDGPLHALGLAGGDEGAHAGVGRGRVAGADGLDLGDE